MYFEYLLLLLLVGLLLLGLLYMCIKVLKCIEYNTWIELNVLGTTIKLLFLLMFYWLEVQLLGLLVDYASLGTVHVNYPN